MEIVSGYGDETGITFLVKKGESEKGVAIGHKFYPPDHPDFSWAVDTLNSLPPPTPTDPEAVLAGEMREQRNLLLGQCDWTQVPDAPVDKSAWATYRQELRDVPQQSGFPDNVIWPEEPK